MPYYTHVECCCVDIGAESHSCCHTQHLDVLVAKLDLAQVSMTIGASNEDVESVADNA